MRTVFADSFYFLAVLNAADDAHGRAAAFTAAHVARLTTTDWVLLEVGDAFSRPPNRQRFAAFYRQLPAMADLTVVPASRELLASGFDLFAQRPDKDWTLTDCISFVVMQQQGIGEALTADRHFEQAGFTALLK
jgi:predicted nucleic acid-binding protein